MLWLVVVVVREYLIALLRSAAQVLYPAEPMGALLPFPTRQVISTTVLGVTSKLSNRELEELERKVFLAAEEVERRLVEDLYRRHP